jgi:hypothetical protein
MSLFNRLFAVHILASVAFGLAAGVLAARRRGAHTLRVLRVWSYCSVVYLAIVVLTSLILPRPRWNSWFFKKRLKMRRPPHSRAEPMFQNPVCMG